MTTTSTIRCACGGFWLAEVFVHADRCTARMRGTFLAACADAGAPMVPVLEAIRACTLYEDDTNPPPPCDWMKNQAATIALRKLAWAIRKGQR